MKETPSVETADSAVLFRRVVEVVRRRWEDGSYAVPPQSLQPMVASWPTTFRRRLLFLRRAKDLAALAVDEGKVLFNRAGRKALSKFPVSGKLLPYFRAIRDKL